MTYEQYRESAVRGIFASANAYFREHGTLNDEGEPLEWDFSAYDIGGTVSENYFQLAEDFRQATGVEGIDVDTVLLYEPWTPWTPDEVKDYLANWSPDFEKYLDEELPISAGNIEALVSMDDDIDTSDYSQKTWESLAEWAIEYNS